MTAALVVDKAGLAKKLADKPKAHLIFELIQNAWDEDVSRVEVSMEMLPGRPVCRVCVEDDNPEGFEDLTSIYTLFKDSKKAPDPEKRGRFELGEKLVAAVALRMEVVTTKGCVIIEGNERKTARNKLKSGSAVMADLRMTREEFKEVEAQIYRLIPPSGIETVFQGLELQQREPLCTFTTVLQTIRSDSEGNLRPTSRKTEVRVYEPLPGETPCIYEMGIPITETGDRWHYDVQQRVPMNWERDRVPPSYLRTLRVEVLNALHDNVPKEASADLWVTEGLQDERCSQDAAKDIKVKRFGEHTVIQDPSDPEANKQATAKGFTVIPGGSLPKGAWKNLRTIVQPAGKVFPTPPVYSENGKDENLIPPEKWTPDMTRIANFAVDLFRELFNRNLVVHIANEPRIWWAANCGPDGVLTLNRGRLGAAWFLQPNRSEAVLDLLVHEFGHYKEPDHLSEAYHKQLTRIAAKLANLCLNMPELFQ